MKHQLINERNEPTHTTERVADVEILFTSEDIKNLNDKYSLSFNVNLKVAKVIIKKEAGKE